MNKNQNWLFDFIFEQKCIPFFIIQIFKKLFLFFKMALKDPTKSIKFWRQCFNKKFSVGGFILHVYGPNFLKDAAEACEIVGVKPFLIFGTLLGFVRENDFISHDHDIDLGLLDEDFQKKHLIKEIILKKGYKQRIGNDYELSFFHPEYPFIGIDFWRVYKKDNHMVLGLLSEDGKNTLFNYYFPLEAMNEFRIVNFHNNKILIPWDPTIFLSTVYGKWQILQKNYHYIYDSKNLHVNDVKYKKSENS